MTYSCVSLCQHTVLPKEIFHKPIRGPSGGLHWAINFLTTGDTSHEKTCLCSMPMDRSDQIGASAPEQSVPTTSASFGGGQDVETPIRPACCCNHRALHDATLCFKACPQESNLCWSPAGKAQRWPIGSVLSLVGCWTWPDDSAKRDVARPVGATWAHADRAVALGRASAGPQRFQ